MEAKCLVPTERGSGGGEARKGLMYLNRDHSDNWRLYEINDHD